RPAGPRGDDDAEAGLRDPPDGMLAAGAAAEVLARDEHRRALRLRPVEGEVRVRRALLLADVVEDDVAVAGAGDPFQVARRHDGVGVDVGTVETDETTGVGDERFHQAASGANSRTSIKCPATAVAAAICGLTRWVRPPGPCRPSKLRLLVL